MKIMDRSTENKKDFPCFSDESPISIEVIFAAKFQIFQIFWSYFWRENLNNLKARNFKYFKSIEAIFGSKIQIIWKSEILNILNH